MTVSYDRNLAKYKLEFSTLNILTKNPHTTTRVFLETILNERQDLKHLLAVVKTTTPLVRGLMALESRRNLSDMSSFHPNRRTVNIIARSAFQFRIIHQPNFCVEISLLSPQKQFRIVDASTAYLPTTHDATVLPNYNQLWEKPSSNMSSLGSQSLVYSTIPFFTSDLQDPKWVVSGVD